MSELLTSPPSGYILLIEHARKVGAHPDSASKAARQGRVPEAVLVHVPGTPNPVWYVPKDCTWRPLSVGRPRKNKGGIRMIEIRNDGQKIVSTNYWQTEYAQNGLMYLSINAGAFRLLLPPSMESALEDMRTSEYVIVSRGTWYSEAALPRKDAFEILFEDHSNAPYSLHIVREQADRLPESADEGREDLTLLVYTKGPDLRLELPARYRWVKKLPYLQAW